MMMTFAAFFRAFDAALLIGQAVRRFRGGSELSRAETGLTTAGAATPGAGQLEAHLTNVVVAALKEAFNRDHARLELERAQLDEQRRRADEALRLELRRQAVDREVARLRQIAFTAVGGWVAAVALVLVRLDTASALSQVVSTIGWLFLLAALGASFAAQGRVGAAARDASGSIEAGAAGAAALWLLIAGLACAAGGLLVG